MIAGRATLPGLIAVLVAGCGGGPGVRGPEAELLFTSYSGTWLLDAAASDSLPALGQPPGPAGRSGGGRDPFGGDFGGRGAMPGGRDGPGGRGGPVGVGGRVGTDGDPAAMQAALLMARERPPRIQLALDDSTFSATYVRGRSAVVPMGGGEVDLAGVRWPTKAKVEWKNRVPTLSRSVEDAGRITDRFELLAEDRLLVTRVFEPPRGGRVEARFVYDRDRGRGGG